MEIDTVIQRVEQLWQQTPPTDQNTSLLNEKDSALLNEFLTAQFTTKLQPDHGKNWQTQLRSGRWPIEGSGRAWIIRRAVSVDGGICKEGETTAGYINTLALNLPDTDFFLEIVQRESSLGTASLARVNIRKQLQTAGFTPAGEA